MNNLKVTNNFSKQKILVIGDFMLDEYIYGNVERISPEAPVPVVLQEKVKIFPGGAGNVVSNLKSLNAEVYVVGVVGKDDGANILKKNFENLGLKKEHFGLYETDNRPTTRKTRIIAERQQLCRVDNEITNPLPIEIISKILEYIKSLVPKMNAIIFSDYDKGLIQELLISETVKIAKKTNCFIAVDPQVTHFNYYKDVDVLTPNHHEAGRYLGYKLIDEENIIKGGEQILENLNAKMLLLTRGEKGMTLFKQNNKVYKHFPTLAREVFDVTGAGDTVISVFTLAVCSGAEIEKAIEMANVAAGIVVGHIGTATVTAKEILDNLQ